MDRVVIYRRQLLKPSEIFIENQVKYFKKFEPIFVGRRLFSSPPKGVKVISFDNQSKLKTLKDVILINQDDYIDKLKREKPKLIHAHFGVDAIYALKIAKSLNIPLITTFHGFDATIKDSSLLFSKKPAWVNYLLFRKELAREGDLFIAVSNFIKERVIELGFPKKKIITHYIGIETDIKREKYKKEGNTILHVARLVEKKGTIYLLKAFKEVLAKKKDSKLIIIGDGILKEKLITFSKELNIDKSVKFLEVQKNSRVLEMMERADIFVLPSIEAKSGDSEGLGMVFLEAGIRGVPLIGTNHGGIPEVIKDNYNGFLVEEKNSRELAQKILELLKDRRKREEFGENGIKFIKENFNIEKESAKLEEIYSSIIK